MVRRRLLVLLTSLALAAGCGSPGGDPAPAAQPTDGSDAVDAVEPRGLRGLTVEVIATHPHDPGAYTQGLLIDGGAFFESTGQYGESDVRQVDIDDGRPVRQVALPSDLFGEGLTLVDDELIQLTWKEEVARVYDRDTLEVVDEHRYEGEGWGLCLDDDRLVMSDGSSRLAFRDPDSFDEIGSVEVTAEGQPVDELNELECVDGTIYANVYRTDEIVVIDPATGQVTESIDASSLRDEDGQTSQAQVLNGIAHDPETGTFFLTGKYWSSVFEVRFVEAADGE